MKRERLLKIVSENREKHVREVTEATTRYGKALLKFYRERIATLEKGEIPKRVYPDFSEPPNHTKDYDGVIDMLASLGVEAQFRDPELDIVELSEQDFTRFVKDDWEWKARFQQTTASY